MVSDSYHSKFQMVQRFKSKEMSPEKLQEKKKEREKNIL